MNEHATGPIDSSAFRKTLGRFASGVTIVTVCVDGQVRGMTANSFCSVSLDPPLIAVSVGRHAAMHGLLLQASEFGVSVLAGNQETLSAQFAGKSPADISPCFVEIAGIPLICGALAHICCTVHSRFETGDHTMYIGRVSYLDSAEEIGPLIFYRGEYRSLSDPDRK